MKNKSIKMKKEIFPRLIISIFTLLLFPVLNIYAQTTPFFVMTPNDKEQYIYTSSYWEFGNTTTTKSFNQTSVDSMVERDGIKFYKGYSVGPDTYFGIDEINNKLYYLNDTGKTMMLDFNILPGFGFTGHFPGVYAPHAITVSGNDSVRYYRYSFSSIQTGSTEYRVEKGFGLRQKYVTYTISNGRGGTDDWSTFNMIRFNQNGDTLYKTQTWAPIITYTPEPTTAVFLKSFNVNTTHDINLLYAQYIPGINFNDSLFVLSYYKNETDSTTPVLSAVAATTPVTTFTLHLDSVKMKAGYKFKYRFTLRDKYYRPKLVSHPSSIGFHTLSYDPSVGLIEDDPQIPVSIDLRSFPNPVSLNNNLGNQSATIRFNMPSAGYAKGTLYDILGRPVAEILEGDFPVGENSIKFNAEGLSSGMYVFRLATKSGSEFIKILVTK
jgi:hypothetical protein